MRRGFTLVETIFSTLFVSVAVLAIVNLFPGAYLSIAKSETRLQADNVANSVMDEVRITPFSELPIGPYSVAAPPFEPWTVENTTYLPRVTIYEVPGTDFTVLKGVRVEVSYRVHATIQTVTHETYIHGLIR